jgi:hypothetical protein
MDGIRTDIFLQDCLHATRRWPAIPRVGDLMWIANVERAPRGAPVDVSDWCVVESVRWIDNGRGDLSHVDIYVKYQPSD